MNDVSKYKNYRKLLFDIEADNLLDDVTKIHCLAWTDTKTGIVNSTSYIEQIKDFFLQEDVIFVGHNIISYDIPVVEKLLNIQVKAPKIDTLGLSWVLSPNRDKHSLESYENEVGIKKVEIKDWSNLTISEYIERCETDVKINYEIWKKQAKYLNELYEGNHEQIYKFLDYVEFKLDCVKEHQQLGVNLDLELCNKALKELENLKESKIQALKEGMPKRAIKSVKFPPKIMYKKDGSPSENRLKWLEFLKNQGLPENYNQEVEYISDYEEPKPTSHEQVKSWLFSIGWQPQHFKYVREDGKKEMRKIPQIKSKDDEGALCSSVIELIEKEPVLENLDSLYVISHRIGVLNGFLRDQKNGRLYQGTRGFTNTMRLMHSVIVNLPNTYKPYSENVRKCLIADEGKIMVGCDLSGIEDSTKRHYIYQYDPAYVESMNTEGYDPHLELAVLAGFLTKEQAEKHKKGEENHKEIRQKAKTANFALTYKTGVETLMRSTGLNKRDAEKLKNTYWKRNKAILDVENSLKVKEINGQKWLLNPVSGFYYTLRAEKDRFSLLNQATAVFIFDLWLYYIRQKGIKINFQYHDEWSANLFEEYQESYTNKINEAIEEVNDKVKLNVKVGCSIEYGVRYTEVH